MWGVGGGGGRGLRVIPVFYYPATWAATRRLREIDLTFLKGVCCYARSFYHG